eukprot:scpid47662/ scgid6228/ Exonuclease 1; Exonuclease I
MGIQGLLPLLKSIHQQVDPKDYRGQTVAIDAYCWLHKGVYACAYELCIGSDTTVYVNYCVKRLKMLLYHNVTPIMVFDGRNLPTKGEKEKERRDNRAKARQAGRQHLEQGNRQKATECFQRCVDITPDMARNVIKTCREMGIQCIVAPYEADAQLAFLQQSGVADIIISEDSDLLAYGCHKVLFKMDAFGSGTLIDAGRFGEVSSVDLSQFTITDFRHMCILSGCDYLASVSGVGLQTAVKLLRKCNKDVSKVISNLRLDCSKRVPTDYEKRFWLAEYTFLYQIVYDPEAKQTRHLTTIPSDVLQLCDDWSFVGVNNDTSRAEGIASGALSLTGEVVPGFDLSKVVSKPQNFKTFQPEAPSSTISAMLPKANKTSRTTPAKANTAASKQSGHCIRSQSSMFARTETRVIKERLPDQSVLMSYGVRKTVAANSSSSTNVHLESPTAERQHHRRSSMAVANTSRLSSPLRDSLGEQVLTDEESSLPGSYDDMEESEEPLSASLNERVQPVAAAPPSATKCTRISKFFAEAAIRSPSSKNTISTMLREASEKRYEEATTHINQYQPPVSVFGAKPKPLGQSNSHPQSNQTSNTTATPDAKKKQNNSAGNGLSMFNYVGKRRSSDSSQAAVCKLPPPPLPALGRTEDTGALDHQPPAKAARRDSTDAFPIKESSMAQIAVPNDIDADRKSDPSPILAGNVADSQTVPLQSPSSSFSARLIDREVVLDSEIENSPPPQPRRLPVEPKPAPISSAPLIARPSPGKKLLATLSKSRRGGSKRLGVGRPASTNSSISSPAVRGFMPGCFDQFKRKPQPPIA